MARWKIDQDALVEASNFLSLEYPVRVTARAMKRQRGKYHGIGRKGPTTRKRLAEPAHHITLKASMAASQANACLWHELAHAQQCERFLGDGPSRHIVATRRFERAYEEEAREKRVISVRTRRGKGFKRYQSISFEAEARECEKNARKIRLCLPVEVRYRAMVWKEGEGPQLLDIKTDGTLSMVRQMLTKKYNDPDPHVQVWDEKETL